MLTPAERNYVNSSRKFKKVLAEFAEAFLNYHQKSYALRQERGMDPFFGGILELNHQLEAAVNNKAARTLQRYRRASTMRRRAAAIGSLSKSLPRNTVRKISSRN